MDMAGERLNHGSSWIMPSWVRVLPKWLLGKVRGVGLGVSGYPLISKSLYQGFTSHLPGASQRSWGLIMTASGALPCLGRQSLVMPMI